MADLISRLRLDSGEFDSKIKRAGQELLAYSEHCKKMGLEMGYANKDAKDFAKALGNMNTVSQTARGKLNELTEAFVNLKAMYNNMTDAEKQNTFGKELAASLDKLKNRIDEAKQNLNSVNAELGNTKQAEDGAKSGLEGLTSALGINVKSLAGWGTALAAGKVALDVAKDAFFASESTVDEWGRTIQSAQGLYEGFLNALNTGDISGYLSRMNDIVTAARAAYDELDKLGTMKTIQAPKVSAQQTENERIRSMIQTGRYIAPVDGRRNAVFNGREMQNGDKLTAGQIRALEKQLQNGMQNVVKLVGNEVKQTGKAIDAYYNSMAKQNGMSLQEFKKGTSSWEEFNKKIQGYEEYKKWDKQARTEFAKQGGRGNVDFDKSNPFAEFKKWGVFRVDKEGGNSYKDLVQLIQQRDQQAGQAYSMQSQAYRTMNRAEGFTVSKLMGNGGKGGKTGKTNIQFADDSIMAQEKLVQELTQKWKTASGELRDGYLKDLTAAQNKLNEMTGKGAKAPEMTTGLSGFNEQTISAWTSMIKSQLAKADIGSDLYNSLTQNLNDMSTLTTAVQDAMKLGLQIPQDAVQKMFEAVFDQENLPKDLYAGMIQKFIDDFKERTGQDLVVGENGSLGAGKGRNNRDDRDNNKLLKYNEETAKYEVKANELLGSMAGGMQNVISGLENLGVSIPEEIKGVIGGMQSISTILTGIATTLIAIEAISSADALIPFARGGIVRAAGGFSVPGNYYSGDRVPALLNSGELVLNKAQQGNLASQLEGGGIQNLNLEAVIRGEDIRLALNNNGRRTGRGEYVQSRKG